MRNFIKILVASIPTVFPTICHAQLCGPDIINSHYSERPLYHATDFIQLSENLEFKSGKSYYAELYVKPRLLNVRSHPHYGNIIATVFGGQKVRVYAQQGEWLAINRLANLERLESQFWVHRRYLSPMKTDHISIDDLLSRCDLDEMVEMLDGIDKTDGCKSVQRYLLWEGSLSTLSYKTTLQQHLRALDKGETYGNLSFCNYPFF